MAMYDVGAKMSESFWICQFVLVTFWPRAMTKHLQCIIGVFVWDVLLLMHVL